MEIHGMTIKEIEELFAAGPVTEELLAACREDPRQAAGRLVRKWEREQAEKQRVEALYAYEYRAHEQGAEFVAGVDEAGRGPLAGPVSVAAVILPLGLFLPRLNDSKKLSAKVRDELYEQILAQALTVQHVFIDEKTIDRINIYQATINGMYDAIFALNPKPQQVLVDAVPLERLPMPAVPLIHGDAKSASIAAASIVAKVKRDRLMDEYDKLYPMYGFAQHKGYGTAQHIAALREYGPCPIHRQSFEPVHSLCSARR